MLTATDVMKGSAIIAAHTEACVLTISATCTADVTLTVFDTSGSNLPAVVGVYKTCTSEYTPARIPSNTAFTFN